MHSILVSGLCAGGGVGGCGAGRYVGGCGVVRYVFKRNCRVKVMRRRYRRAATADVNSTNRRVKECL